MNADVARILGWTLGSCGTWDELIDEWDTGGDDERQVLHTGYGNEATGALTTPYTADDLAAWIHKRLDWITFGMCWGEHGEIDTWTADACNVSGDGYNEPAYDIDHVSASGPTILACLEQLVLQIGAD